MRFDDRGHAGRVLAQELLARDVRGGDLRGSGTVVLALPRGGVPVGCEVARALGASLDVVVVRKLGVPGHEELAMGAIASGGAGAPVRVLNDDVMAAWIARGGGDMAMLARVEERERAELARRERAFRGDRAPVDIAGRTVVVVDDGLATGATMRAAVRAVRARAPARIVVAVPVGAAETCRMIRREADDVVCALALDDFVAVGLWYRDFTQTSDDEVRALLDAFCGAGRGHDGNHAVDG